MGKALTDKIIERQLSALFGGMSGGGDYEFGAGVEFVKKTADPLLSSTLATQATARQLAETFVRLAVDESTLLREIRTLFVNEPSGDIAKLNISGHFVRKATENTADTETRRPVTSGLTYTTVKARAQMDVPAETIEDNIEGEGGMAAFTDAFMVGISNDLEMLAIQGDSSLSGTDDESMLLKTNDGFHVLSTTALGTHTKNAGAKRVSWKLLSEMYRDLPTKYRRNRANLRWIAHPDVFLDLQGEIVERTTGLGDLAYQNDAGQFAPLGIRPLEVALLPTDLTATGTDSTGTFIMLCDPRNLIHVVQRRLRVATKKAIRKDIFEVTALIRNDFLIENTDAVVKATDVVLDTSASRFGAT